MTKYNGLQHIVGIEKQGVVGASLAALFAILGAVGAAKHGGKAIKAVSQGQGKEALKQTGLAGLEALMAVPGVGWVGRGMKGLSTVGRTGKALNLIGKAKKVGVIGKTLRKIPGVTKMMAPTFQGMPITKEVGRVGQALRKIPGVGEMMAPLQQGAKGKMVKTVQNTYRVVKPDVLARAQQNLINRIGQNPRAQQWMRAQVPGQAAGEVMTRGQQLAQRGQQLTGFSRRVEPLVFPLVVGGGMVLEPGGTIPQRAVAQEVVKRSQDYSALAYSPQIATRTLGDLFMAVRADQGLSIHEKAQLINQIKGVTGFAGESTPLSALMLKGLGGTIGLLIAKYFGLGAVGQLVSAAAGYGVGSAIHKHMNRPPDPYPGWRMLA